MSLRILKNHFGQGAGVEYAILFFIIIAVTAGMTTYVKRAMQGRIHDARNYMYKQVNSEYRAWHNSILPSGYEPYYQHTRTDKDERSTTTQTEALGDDHKPIYGSSITSVVGSSTFSNVTSAIHAE